MQTRIIAVRWTLASALACLVLAGCSSGGEDDFGGDAERDGETATLQSALRQSGSPTITSCDSEELAMVNSAFSMVRNRLHGNPSSTQMLECFKKAIFSASYAYPEALMSMLREDVATTIECVEGRSGNGFPEAIFLGTDDFALALDRESQSTDTQLAEKIMADVLIHELAHTKGHLVLPQGTGHPGPATFPTSTTAVENLMVITQLVTACLFDSTPHDFSFDSTPYFLPDRVVMGSATGEATLSPVGKAIDNTAPAENFCFSTEKASGLAGRAFSLIDALGMVCRGTEGGEITNTSSGGPGGQPFNVRCPADEIMVGVRGRSGAALDAIGPICARSTSVANGGQATGVSPIIVGGTGGHAFERRCPPFQVVKGARIRHAGHVRRLDVLCQRHDQLRNIHTSGNVRLGASPGSADMIDDEQCPSRSAMKKLWAVTDNGRLRRLGAGCTKVSNTCAGCQITVGTGANDANHMLPFHGFPQVEHTGSTEAVSCTGNNSALVGLTTWTLGNVSAIRGTCASNAAAWSTGASTATFDTTRIGILLAGATTHSFTCPSRSFLTGWHIAETYPDMGVASPGIMHITPRCRRF